MAGKHNLIISALKAFELTTNLRRRKVAFVLNILGLTYEPRYLKFNEIKCEEHLQYNPNGRIPTLIDHLNGDFVIWYCDSRLCRRCLS